MKLKQRFLRTCHILRHWPWEPHMAVTVSQPKQHSDGRITHIRCTCGKEWD